jgi:hypothetical protein
LQYAIAITAPKMTVLNTGRFAGLLRGQCPETPQSLLWQARTETPRSIRFTEASPSCGFFRRHHCGEYQKRRKSIGMTVARSASIQFDDFERLSWIELENVASVP